MAHKQTAETRLTFAEQALLRSYLSEHGEVASAKAFCIGRGTLLRALSGLEQRPATVHFIRSMLADGVPL